jgi:hypothetical protein
LAPYLHCPVVLNLKTGKKKRKKRLPCVVHKKIKIKNKTYPAGYEKKGILHIHHIGVG